MLYERLLPYGDRVAICYPDICTGAVSLYLGMLRPDRGLLGTTPPSTSRTRSL